MPHTISFESSHSYDDNEIGITVPVELRLGERVVRLNAKLDTGASFCIFRRDYADSLGLNLEIGSAERIGLAIPGNSFLVYGHDVTLTTFNIELDTKVYFASDYTFKRNVLGRRGWIDLLKIGLIDYDRKLFVSSYDE